MEYTIKFLLKVIAYQSKIIYALMIFSISRNLDFFEKIREDKPVRKEYQKLVVDKMPLLKVKESLDFNSLLTSYLSTHGKPLKPVKHRPNSKVPTTLVCPLCGAPHTYIYDNNGGKGQFLCKVCSHTFFINSKPKKDIIFICPHCGATLELIKKRKNFIIYKCKNDLCSFYANNLNSMTSDERKDFKKNPHKYKLRYIFRKFIVDFLPLDNSSPVLSKVNLPNIRVSQHTLGLILTYNINYGIPARTTAKLMKDVHGISISHQSILNYAEAVSVMLKPFIDTFPYDLSDSFCADETYIKINGVWNYIFFFFDAKKKIILSNRTSPNRDTLSCIKAFDDVLRKFKTIPDNLKFITDGNPIYLLARHFFAEHGISFDVEQVIGLTNSDPVSKEHRPLKQIVERLNRTFKYNYKPTCGYGSSDGAIAHVTLFTAYFNFLRTHSSISNSTPVVIPELSRLPHMPDKWSSLISLAQNDILKKQPA
jgi:transposase-like protein/transcription elongation factor Elf1